ncbi:hypothetical protein D3C85_1837580 [compost metagenome]
MKVSAMRFNPQTEKYLKVKRLTFTFQISKSVLNLMESTGTAKVEERRTLNTISISGPTAAR